MEALGEKYGEKLKVAKVDVTKNRRLCISLKVLGLPTFLFYKNGGEVNRLGGDGLTIDEVGWKKRTVFEE